MTVKQTHFTRARSAPTLPEPPLRRPAPRLRVVREYEIRRTVSGWEVLAVGGIPFAWFLFEEDAVGFAGRCGK